jgi:hypothetical protein
VGRAAARRAARVDPQSGGSRTPPHVPPPRVRPPPPTTPPPQNAEIFTLTYGSIVRQLITDFEDLDEVNKQLDQM